MIPEDKYQDLRDSRVRPRSVFEYNVETLASMGIAEYEDADRSWKAIPENGFFLWIPPQPAGMDLYHLMSRVMFNGNHGRNGIGRQSYWNVIEVPSGPYFALNIYDGRERLGIEKEESVAGIRRSHRLAYTLLESIVHSILYPVIFTSHNLTICGSECESGRTLSLSLDQGIVKLIASLFDLPSPRSGMPSCEGRLAI
jgi:hypothetical protein